MKNYIKNNKFSVVAIIIFTVIVIALIQVKLIFFPSEGKAIYGDRLKNLKEYALKKDEKSKIISSLEDDSAVKKATIRMSGKTIEVSIEINDDIAKDTAKSLTDKVTSSLSEDQKKYFDIQVFISKSSDAKDFPIIGYKQRNKDGFTFTKDR